MSGSGRVEELDGSVSGSGSGGDADYHLRYGSSRASGWDQTSGRDNGAVALRPRGGYIRGPTGYDNEDDDDDDDDDSASEVTSDDDSDDGLSEPGEAELAVLESAMARIRRAQVKQKAQVNLSKAELAALSRHKERQRQAQERVLKRNKRRDRVAVPIEHLGAISHGLAKLPTPVASGDDSSPQRIPGSFHDDHGYSPGGYYSPPSRALPSSSSQPALGQQDRYRDDSPFTYSYVHGQPNTRHVSDSATGAQQANPFKYMTTDSRAPPSQYGSVAAAPTGRQGTASYSRGSSSAAVPAAARGRRSIHTGETSEDEESSSEDDDDDDDAQPQRAPVHNTRSRAKQPVASSHSRRHSRVPGAESESEPRPGSKGQPDRSQSAKTKKSSHSSSATTMSTKHKSSAGGSGSGATNSHSSSRRRKGK